MSVERLSNVAPSRHFNYSYGDILWYNRLIFIYYPKFPTSSSSKKWRIPFHFIIALFFLILAKTGSEHLWGRGGNTTHCTVTNIST